MLGQSERLQGSGTFSIATGLGAGPQAGAQGRAGPPVGAGAGAGGEPVAPTARRQRRRGDGDDEGGKRAPGDGDGSSLDEVPEEESKSSRRASTRAASTRRSWSASTTPPGRCWPRHPRGHGPIARLYRGETRFDFVGRRKIWFSISAAIIVLGIISIVLRGGLNLGIEFKGGTEWTIAAPGVTQTQATDAMKGPA